MDEVETEFSQSQRFKAQVWLKYIDIFFIWTHYEENLYLFRKDLNNFTSNLKFIFEGDRNSINFLDRNVMLNNDELTTSVYIKPTYRYQYLYYRSSHPENIDRSIVYSKTLRASRYVHLKKIL